jgi:hypothetical protein
MSGPPTSASVVNSVTNDTNYKYISFTTVGNTSLTVNYDFICDILLIGGGGGGGYNGGGGGGGGQFAYYTNNEMTPKSGNAFTLKKGTYTISIGDGGTVSGSTDNINGGNGGSSSIINSSSVTILTAKGGGGGGSKFNLGTSGDIGGVGGSGHLNNAESLTSLNNCGKGGRNGGSASVSSACGGGGGGGVNTFDTYYYYSNSVAFLESFKNGEIAYPAIRGGNGGYGLDCDITGTFTKYSGGGGGGSYAYSGGTGLYGGGNGATTTATAPTAGTANTGGGGGGGGYASTNGFGARGGSGIIIIRYLVPNIQITGTGNLIKNVVNDFNYSYMSFITNGTLTLKQSLLCDILAVGGGGSGGYLIGGGGGGGAVVYIKNALIQSGTYNITVGNGGPQHSSDVIINNKGGSTTFNGIIAEGGGGGARYGGRPTENAASGGSGGGTGSESGYLPPLAGETGTGSSLGGFIGTIYQNKGGMGLSRFNCLACGGGGGAGEKGQYGNFNDNGKGGKGGDGIMINIIGSNLYWGAGGGGSQYNSSDNVLRGGSGGLGGGGGGCSSVGLFGYGGLGGLNIGGNGASPVGGAGAPNTGSGGGGGGWYNGAAGGAGGSGILIIRFFKLNNNIAFKNYITMSSYNIFNSCNIISNYNTNTSIYSDIGYLNIELSGTGNTSNIIFDNINNKTINYVSFINNGSLTLKTNYICDILVVGGGGSGGVRHGGGGGAGALIYLQNQQLNKGIYTIQIGEGGAAINSVGNGNNGNDTTITYNSTIIYNAKGGGGGANVNYGLSGGSSGGSSGGTTTISNPVLTTNIPSGAYGNLGGKGSSTSTEIHFGGGGGGGAGSVGADANLLQVSAIGGDGGEGLSINITGTYKYYAAGGGGGIAGGGLSAGLGGSGIGGNGSKSNTVAGSGVANTGSGGGGAGFSDIYNGTSGAGGKGIVIIKFIRLNRIEALDYNAKNRLSYLKNEFYNTPSAPIKISDLYLNNNSNMIDIPNVTSRNTPVKMSNFKNRSKNLFNITVSGTENTYKVIPSPVLISPDYTDFYIKFLHQGSTNTTTTNNYTEYSIRIPFQMNVELLLVGGGGGGGAGGGTYGAAGGGSGGLIYTPLTLKENTTYKIIVGAGGLGMQTRSDITTINGTSTLFYENNSNIPLLTALGGARGYNSGIAGSTIITKSMPIRSNINISISSGTNNILFNYTKYETISSTGSYNIIFSNGTITINTITDKSYPILKTINNITINPIVWYKFENSSIFLNEATNSIYNLTNNGATFDTTTLIKGAGSIKFTASSSQYVTIPSDYFDLNTINIKDGISFSIWFKFGSNSGSWARILDFGLIDATKWIIIAKTGSDNSVHCKIYNAGVFDFGITLPNIVAYDNNWKHLVWTISNTGFWTIYVNNIIVVNSQYYLIPQFLGATKYYLGKSQFAQDGYYDGNIDDFRLYNIELNAEQVLELYNGRVEILSSTWKNIDGGSGAGNDGLTRQKTDTSISLLSRNNGFGNNGGGTSSSVYGSGGGGAGSVGGNASGTNAGNGGNAILISITSNNEYYAAGGGGSSSGTFGFGGIGEPGVYLGGIGIHNTSTIFTSNAVENTGSGGGGSYNGIGGNGSAGICILKYNPYICYPRNSNLILTDVKGVGGIPAGVSFTIDTLTYIGATTGSYIYGQWYGVDSGNARSLLDRNINTLWSTGYNVYFGWSDDGWYGGGDYLVNDYKGHYVWIKYPYSIMLKEYKVISNQAQCRSWRIYGSNDGLNWENIPEAFAVFPAFTSKNEAIRTLSSYSKPYKYFGMTIGNANGNSSGVMNSFEIAGLVYNLTNFNYTEPPNIYIWQFFNNTEVVSGEVVLNQLLNKKTNTLDSILRTVINTPSYIGVYIYDGVGVLYDNWNVFFISTTSTINLLYTRYGNFTTNYPNNRYAFIHIEKATNNNCYQIKTYASLTNTAIYVKPSSIYANYTGNGPFIKNGNGIIQWNDISGNNRHIYIYRGTPFQTTFSGGTYGITGTSTFNTVGGTTSDGFQLPFKLPINYTFAYVARYRGAAKGRIFDSTMAYRNCLWGFHDNKVGLTHHREYSWKTSTDTKMSDTNFWLIGVETQESSRFNGIEFANKYFKQNNYSFPPRSIFSPVISINYGTYTLEYYSSENSDWEIAEIIIYDYELTEDEQIKLENYLAIKYNHFSFKSVVPDFNTYSSLSQVSKTDGWHNIWNGGRYIYKTSPTAKWYGPGLGTFYTYNNKSYWGYAVINADTSYISGYSSRNNLNYLYNITIPESANIHLILGGGGGGGGGNYGAGAGGAGLVYMLNHYNLENTKYYLSIGARGRGGNHQNSDVYTTSGGDTSIQFIKNNTSNIITAYGGSQGGQGVNPANNTSYRPYGLGGNYGYVPNQYPPIKFTTATSETTTTSVLGKTSYTQTLSLSSNIFYGGGNYIIYSSSTYNAFYKSLLFEYTDSSFDNPGCHFESGLYNYNGVYTGANFIISGYTGDWIIIKFPKPISLSHYDVFARRGVLYRAPAEWKFYASNDGINFIEIVDGSQATRLTTTDYNSYFCYTKIVNSLTRYSYYGMCINKLAGIGVENPSILNFTQLRFYGDEFDRNNIELIPTLYVYPPSSITTITPATPTPVQVLFLNNRIGIYSTTITISSSQTNGNGIYIIYANSSTTKYQLLTSTTTDISWDANKYDSTGVYLSGSTGRISQEVYATNYKGDWVVIQLPKPIIISSYKITASSANQNNAPGEWKMYCSNDGYIFYEFPAGSVTTRIGTANYSSSIYSKSVASQTIPYLYYGFVFNKLAGNATTLIFRGISFTGQETLNFAFKGFSGGIGLTVDNNNYLGGALYPLNETINSTSLLTLLTSQYGIASQNSTSVDGGNVSGNGGLGARDAIPLENNARHGQNGGWGFAVILFDVSPNNGSSAGNAALSGWHLAQYSKTNNLNLSSGTYWIKSPKMPNALQMYVDMTRDGGGYDFYLLTNATSRNYVTQDTGASALGLDIYYPRSKEHWAAIYNFGVTINNLNMINTAAGAVHRNGGGGNYTSTIMRSSRYYETGTTDWRVPDDGKWYLRDTTFSEPNGDYYANAFLGIWSIDNLGNITFNDGNDSFYTGTTIICSTNVKGSSPYYN